MLKQPNKIAAIKSTAVKCVCKFTVLTFTYDMSWKFAEKWWIFWVSREFCVAFPQFGIHLLLNYVLSISQSYSYLNIFLCRKMVDLLALTRWCGWQERTAIGSPLEQNCGHPIQESLCMTGQWKSQYNHKSITFQPWRVSQNHSSITHQWQYNQSLIKL